MKISMLRQLLLIGMTGLFLIASGQENEHSPQQENKKVKEAQGKKKSRFDTAALVSHHVSDSHDYEFELPFFKKTIHLPVILWTKKGLSIFSSAKFEDDNEGKVVVTDSKGNKLVRIHEVIYYADKVKNVKHPSALNFTIRPLDFSITRDVVAIVFVFFLLWLTLYYTKKAYQNPKKLPKGIAGLMEPIILFIRDEVAKPSLGDKYERYMPYLLTVFFFILYSNLVGLIPLAPFGHNLTGNILITFVLAGFTFFFITFHAKKDYWKHIFMPPVPKVIWPIMIPVEIMGIFIKPFALMVRLFANILAGHTMMISLVALIFMFSSIKWGFVSGFFVVFMSFIELLVAFLQAYIFTILSAVFIGMAIEEHHEEEHETA